MHKVSIIIPCYNQGVYLSDALESLINQIHTDWECLIVNDGSNDCTEDVSVRYCRLDNRIKYYNKKNGGLSSARNEGLKYIKGEYVQFLDADDVILPEKLFVQLNSFNEHPDCDVVICDYYPSEENNLSEKYKYGRYLTPFPQSDDFLKHLILDWEDKFSIPCHCFLFRASFFQKDQIKFDETLPNHEDWDCWMQIFTLRPNIFFNKEILSVYRIRDAAMCSNMIAMNNGFLQTLLKQSRLHSNNALLRNLLIQKINKIKYGIPFRNNLDKSIYFFNKRLNKNIFSLKSKTKKILFGKQI
jgi:glycosyltransferase involved in cell wall biosynthesis